MTRWTRKATASARICNAQGGPAGYESREYIATPSSADVVSAGQVYAWNPSITGTKSEDTILVGETGNEVLTTVEGWPTVSVAVGDQTFARPAILEIHFNSQD